jgi:hypothetical protein
MAVNYCLYFIPVKDWNMTRSMNRVKNFITTVKNSGYENISVFIDDKVITSEALEKTQKRRVKEILQGYKNVPYGTSTLLGDMFKECDVDVYYSHEADNDDTIAYFAQRDGADILSGDKDMFRYIGYTYTIYKSFKISNGCLNLELAKIPYLPIDYMREFLTTTPETKIHPNFFPYIRGVVSHLQRELNISPHHILKPLREHIMFILGINEVKEIYPEWNEELQSVIWHNDICYAKYSDRMDKYLDHPQIAMDGFFPLWWEINDYEHHFCIRSLIFQYFSFFLDYKISLWKLWNDYENELLIKKRNTKKSKK